MNVVAKQEALEVLENPLSEREQVLCDYMADKIADLNNEVAQLEDDVGTAENEYQVACSEADDARGALDDLKEAIKLLLEEK